MSENETVIESQPQEQVVQQPQEQEASTQLENNPAEQASELLSLSKERLVDMVHEGWSESKKRRLKLRETESKLDEIQREKDAERQKALEDNQEWEKLYKDKTESTKDYEDLKEFKQNYLTKCKENVNKMLPQLTKAENELFELSSKNMTYDEQIAFIEKLVSNRNTTSLVDNTQSTKRTNGNDDGQAPEQRTPFIKPKSPFDNVMNILAKGKTTK